MIYLLLFYVITLIGTFFYLKWHNSHFDNTSSRFFKSEDLPYILIPGMFIFIGLVSFVMLTQHKSTEIPLINEPNKYIKKFKEWWGEK